MSYRWWSACRTTAGRQRKVNEDAVLDLHDVGLWLVADGMGGHARGDLASMMIAESLLNLPRARSMDEFATAVRTRLEEANQRVYMEAARYGYDCLMGSTVVALLVFRRQWLCLWVGDSRAYLLREGQLTQLTRDHNVAQDLVERGALKREQAATHPAANRLTRALGTQPELMLDERAGMLRDGDLILLCTDGLNKELSDEEIAEVLGSHDCDEASLELVDLTLERGARDNVTVAVVRFEATTGFSDAASDQTERNYGVPMHSHRGRFRPDSARLLAHSG